MNIQARVTPIENESKVKGLATVLINGIVAINSVKVIDGSNGLFVKMPNVKNKNGEWEDVAFPITAEARKQLSDTVLEAYQNLAKEKLEMEAVETRISVSLSLNNNDNNIKAAGQITLDDSIVIKNVRVIEGQHGLFVQMPTYKDSNDEYHNFAHPITKEFHEKVKEAVLKKYNARLDNQNKSMEKANEQNQAAQTAPAKKSPRH